jgi:hypothetical protein
MQHQDTEVVIKKSKTENSEDAKLRRFKEKYVFMIGLAVICVFFLICVYFVFQSPSNSIAMSSAFGIVMGFSGYILRGKT